MRNWARCCLSALLVLCLLPVPTQEASMAAVTPVTAQAVTGMGPRVLTAAQATRKTTAAPIGKPGSWAEIFVRADLQADGQYKFVGGLTGNLLAGDANAWVRLNVTPLDKPSMLAPWEWRWMDQTFGDMQPIVGYPEVRKTRALYMASTEPLEVSLDAIAHDEHGNVVFPAADMYFTACQGSTCPRHLQIDLQVYYGTDGVQVTLTTETLVPPGTTLRNGFFTHPGGSLLGNNLPQQSYPAYGPGGPGRKTSQIVIPHDVGLNSIDAYAAESALAVKDWFIPGDAFALATTDVYTD